MSIKPEKIQAVEVNYPRQKGSGFSIRRSGDTLKLNAENELVEISNEAPKQRLLESYLEGFSYVPLFRRENDNPIKDSIQSMIPFAELRITKESGDVEELTLVPAHGLLNDGTRDLEGPFTNYWVNRRPGGFQTVQKQQLQQWLRDYRSFF
jgi:hypothetical protein